MSVRNVDGERRSRGSRKPYFKGRSLRHGGVSRVTNSELGDAEADAALTKARPSSVDISYCSIMWRLVGRRLRPTMVLATRRLNPTCGVGVW
jgi:hypothetical protein